MASNNKRQKKTQKHLLKRIVFPIMGLASVVWFLIRVVPKPSRALYPCQQAAFPVASAFVVWLFGLGAGSLLLGRTRRVETMKHGRTAAVALTVVGFVCIGVHLQTCTENTYLDANRNDAADESDPDTQMETDAVVAITQAETDATALTQEQIRALVIAAVTDAGGLDFIKDGQAVVLKPNLVTTTTAGRPLPDRANGITTDFRITLAVAEMVREKNPSGQILVMEGSVQDTEDAFTQYGYTKANFGAAVDAFIPIEGASCNSPSTEHLTQAEAASGKTYWVDERFLNADVVISLPVLKTHMNAGITGAIKNIGIGMTPAGKYKGDGFDCTRDFNTINHDDPNALSSWIRDVYSLNPADFAVMDGLRGCANGPEPSWAGGNYATDVKNMRLILAGKDAVALDTVEALVMGCDPDKVPYLQMMGDGAFGATHPDNITVKGKSIESVRQALGGSFACPG